MNLKARLGSLLLFGLTMITSLPAQGSTSSDDDSPLPCMNGSEQPCWDNLKIGVGMTRPQPVGHIWGSLAYSNSFGGYDSWGLNPAFLTDYEHITAVGANTDVLDAGFAMFGAPGGNDQISQQIGLEALLSTANHNADAPNKSEQDSGYTVGFIYRAAIPVTGSPPIDIQLRFLHEHLTNATISSEEFEIAYLWNRAWPGIFFSYRHDNTPLGIFLIGIRMDFNSDSD